MIDLSFVKLYFSSNIYYVQFNHFNRDIKVPAIPSAAHVRLPNRQCHAFLQERIQYTVKKVEEKSHVRSWEGAPKKCAKKVKKVAEESKKDKLIDFRRTWN